MVEIRRRTIMSYVNCDEIIHEYENGMTQKCGESNGWELMFCKFCEKQNEEKFPQGWTFYPGDVCEHGNYVGGCGADYMCGQCESGED